MNDPDRNYYERRAEAEIERAAASTCPEAVRVHYILAGHYLDRVYGEPRQERAVSDD